MIWWQYLKVAVIFFILMFLPQKMRREIVSEVIKKMARLIEEYERANPT